MQFGMIGLGRMGANMTLRLRDAGHSPVVFDVSPAATARLQGANVETAASIRQLTEKLSARRVVFVMVPAAYVDSVLGELLEVLAPNDIVIDGGNSNYQDSMRRAREASMRGVHFVDMGTSGGVWGLERGYCLMLGGDEEAIRHIDPLLSALAPGEMSGVPRTAGRAQEGATTAERGYLRCGQSGAGHFVKMVHNGIEYALMAAYAEGLGILKAANRGTAATSDGDAESTPLRDPEHYQFDFDVAAISEVWRRGSVITSWLLDLTAEALAKDQQLSAFSGHVADSGEGRWTVAAANELGVPAHVITSALYQRFASRNLADYQNRVLSAMRLAFGGHQEKV